MAKQLTATLRYRTTRCSWQFVPQQPWAAGEYSLMVEPNLEDVSGNRVGRAFEVDEDRTEPGPATPVRRVFTVVSERR